VRSGCGVVTDGKILQAAGAFFRDRVLRQLHFQLSIPKCGASAVRKDDIISVRQVCMFAGQDRQDASQTLSVSKELSPPLAVARLRIEDPREETRALSIGRQPPENCAETPRNEPSLEIDFWTASKNQSC
jgi:hypothetical protein